MKMTKSANTALTIAIAAALTMPVTASAAAKKKTHATRSYSSAARVETRIEHDLDSKVAKLEAELQQLRGQIAATRTEAKSNLNAVVAQTQAKEAAQDAEIAKDEEPTSRLFFRGGYAALTHNVTTTNTAIGALTATSTATTNGYGAKNAAGEGWGVGVGLEHGLTKNLFGLTDALSLGAELGILYTSYGTLNGTAFTTAGASNGGVNISGLQITASPKLRVNNLGGFSPWVIPVGLAIGVIGTPSNQLTYITPGLTLGAGLDYDFTKEIFAGFDFRYQFYGNNLNQGNASQGAKQTSLDGLQAGANLGFRF